MRRDLHRSLLLLQIIAVTCALLASAAAQNASPTPPQSLADIARQQKKQQQQQTKKPASRVYDNDGLSTGHDATSGSGSSSTSKGEDNATAATNEKQSAVQWTQQIHGQKQAVSNLTEQTDKLKASIHYVTADGYSNGVQYNQAQKRNQDALEQMQHQLESEKKKLDDMQDACRKQGYGSNVCDAS